MREYLKKSGLATIIVVSIIAMAFLPRRTSQMCILVFLSAWGITKAVLFLVANKKIKEKFSKSFKRTRKRNKRYPLDFNYAQIQLAQRITDKLKSKYPDSRWEWLQRPNANLFMYGGSIRIKTVNTNDCHGADVILDCGGRMDIKMIIVNSIENVNALNNPEQDFDVKMWYENYAAAHLATLITELNSNGTKMITIDETGNITMGENINVGTLSGFPKKNLWKQLIEVFEENDLKVVEYDKYIQLGW